MLGFLKREYDTFVLSKYQASSEWPMPMKKLNRREVLKVGAMASVGAAAKRCLDQGLLACSQDTPPAAWKPGDPIQYINPKIPGFELPPYRGERYEATVPDTLDIAERARLAIHALTEVTNPLADHEIYCIVYLHTNPPSMMHVGLSKDAPIGLVPDELRPRPWLGVLGFVGSIVWLYGWMLRRSAATR